MTTRKDDMEKTELKNCPFCGSKARVFELDNYGGNFQANCLNKTCQANRGGWKNTKQAAIRAWNRRTQ
jgi:Lar family restriction alleviation protein